MEDGPTRQVLTHPRSAFAARLADINLVVGTATDTGLLTTDGQLIQGRPDPEVTIHSPAVALFPPAAVAVHRATPTGSPRNHLPVTIAAIEPRGAVVRIRAAASDGAAGLFADVTAAAVTDLDLVPGQQAYFAVKATEVAIHSRASTS